MLQHLITQDDDLRMIPTDRNQLSAAVQGLREELRSLLAGADPGQERVLARWVGIGLVTLGAPHEAQPFLHQALALAEGSGNPGAVIATRLNLADAHRYSGDTATADTLYRSALDGARSDRTDLIDFALQHLGKHLMEQGDLVSAGACLREAHQLRLAKGDTGLIESTQAAIDRVEVLTRQAAAPDHTQAAQPTRATALLPPAPN